MALGDEKYVLFTTFRRDGRAVSTPVWAVPLDGSQGTFGFWTSSGSGKAKRLAHTDRVTAQPCNARGRVRPGTSPVYATARLVAGAEYEELRRRVVAKYGVMTKLTRVAGNVITTLKGKHIPYGDRGVVVTPSAPTSTSTSTSASV